MSLHGNSHAIAESSNGGNVCKTLYVKRCMENVSTASVFAVVANLNRLQAVDAYSCHVATDIDLRGDGNHPGRAHHLRIEGNYASVCVTHFLSLFDGIAEL